MKPRAKQELTAIIYDKRGRVLSVGKNSYVKTHPRMLDFSKAVGLPDKQFLHAEIDAIIKCRDLSKAHKISVFRFNKQGGTLLAKPCVVCQSAIQSVGIGLIEHT